MSHDWTGLEIGKTQFKLKTRPRSGLGPGPNMPIRPYMGVLQSNNKRIMSELDISDLGVPDTARYNVLTLVINEEYDRAIKYLKDYSQIESAYPNFKDKIERYIRHAIDLVFAIRNKRNFPGMSLLTRSKQNEMRERVREHFQELKMVMRKVEASQEELRIIDIKSTTILVKGLWLSVVIVFLSAFVIEVAQGVGQTFMTVGGDYIDVFIDVLFSYLNLR